MCSSAASKSPSVMTCVPTRASTCAACSGVSAPEDETAAASPPGPADECDPLQLAHATTSGASTRASAHGACSADATGRMAGELLRYGGRSYRVVQREARAMADEAFEPADRGAPLVAT